MTWSYSPDQLNKPLYLCRLELGDVVCGDQQFQDEEINAALARRGSVYGACADLCRAYAARVSRSVDQAVTGAAAKFSQMSRQYRIMALTYEAKAASSGMGTPYAGAISLTDKNNQVQDQDRVPPLFQRGMHDNLIPVAPTGLESEDVGGD